MPEVLATMVKSVVTGVAVSGLLGSSLPVMVMEAGAPLTFTLPLLPADKTVLQLAGA